MDLQTWDKTISPHLQRIENIAEATGRNARYIKTAVAALPQRPEWQTRAREALDTAGAELLAALKQIHDASEAYDAKPLIVDAA